VKLAAELSRPDTGRTFYFLDEPTTGLHFEDLAKLLDVLNRLVDLGNTVAVIEHNLDVIKTADWLIEIGPQAGELGGYVVASGTPEQIAAHAQAERAAAAASKKNGSGAELLRCHTGEVLAPVLEAGPHLPRQMYDFSSHDAKRAEDLDIAEVGQDAKMPWETDGRRWHIRDRVGRSGETCQWDGRILDEVEQRIHALGEFSPTDWSKRSVVEIAADRKSDGWFMHAITGETWLLKLKFRVAKNTFKRDQLIADLALKPLNDLSDLPVYGSKQRVRCKNLRGPWQEVQVDVHSWEEIDTPAFWEMIERAVQGFFKFTERVAENPENVMPWKKLGQKWHFSRKGFPPGKKVSWETEVLEELCEMLADVAPDGQFLWNSQQVVHLMVKEQNEPWATLHTKRTAGVDLILGGPKDRFALGRIAELGSVRDFHTERPERDFVKIRFNDLEDLAKGDLDEFLKEHRESLEND
jgi:excinuclease ABC subunit A